MFILGFGMGWVCLHHQQVSPCEPDGMRASAVNHSDETPRLRLADVTCQGRHQVLDESVVRVM